MAGTFSLHCMWQAKPQTSHTTPCRVRPTMMEVQWLHFSGDENVRMRNWCALAFGPTWIIPWCGAAAKLGCATGGGGGGGWPCILAPGGGTAPNGCEYSSDDGERSDADAFDRDEPTLSRLAAAAAASAAAPRESWEARWPLLSNPRPCC